MPVLTNHLNRFRGNPGALRGLAALGTGAALLAALLGAPRPATAQPGGAPPIPPGAAATPPGAEVQRYRVVNLGVLNGGSKPVINASGQVAVTLTDGSVPIASFFDGKRVQSIGTLGGTFAFANALNDRGQVTGGSSAAAADGRPHAFLWSSGAGMRDLDMRPTGESYGTALNAAGDVVGYARLYRGAAHAFRWTERTGQEDLGTLKDDLSSAVAINDSGVVSGVSWVGVEIPHAFVWTRDRGMEDLGTLGGDTASAIAVGARGEVTGLSALPRWPGTSHTFFWTRAGGLRDLGALNGNASYPTAMSAQAQVAGIIDFDDGHHRAFSWTAASGMRELGSFGGPSAGARAVNGKGQVVGYAMDKQNGLRAFLWSAGQGLVDLNTRLVNAPAGLVLNEALAIGDNGAIVASSTVGLVLLRPLAQASVAAPVLGPIEAPALVRADSAITARVAFNNSNPREQHHASVQWGDATVETALVRESGAAGTAWARHAYRAPGLYTIIATVTDSAGNTTTVKRDVVVEGAGAAVAGSGTLFSPPGAVRGAPAQTGLAVFRWVAPGTQSASGLVQFDGVGLGFRSTSVKAAAAGADGVHLSGAGTLNGKDGYRYALAVAPGVAAQGEVTLRIWHLDARSGAALLDYDNGLISAAQHGTLLAYGAIALSP